MPLETRNRTKDSGFWDRNKMKLLLNLCTDRKFKNFNPKDKSLWREIAPFVGTTPESCYRKYLNLKSSFIRVYKKKLLGRPTKWPYFEMCEEAFRKCMFMSPDMLETWDENRTRTLLTLYIDYMENGQTQDKNIWREIGLALGTTHRNVYKKFKYLKRTYIKILERTRERGKLIKWPYNAYFQRIVSEDNPRQWNDAKIRLLLDEYIKRAHKFASPRFKKKELWKEISDIVGESVGNCDKKFRNLKLTFVKYKQMTRAGRKTNWQYVKQFEQIAERSKHPNDSAESEYFLNKYKPQNYITELLTFYKENISNFRNPLVKNKLLWKVIAKRINLSPAECDKKFRNLKQTYIRHIEVKERTGKETNWPYFSIFESIYNSDDIRSKRQAPKKADVEDVMLSAVQNVVHGVNNRREQDKKFERLISVVEESNSIQKERNRILQALLESRNRSL